MYLQILLTCQVQPNQSNKVCFLDVAAHTNLNAKEIWKEKPQDLPIKLLPLNVLECPATRGLLGAARDGVLLKLRWDIGKGTTLAKMIARIGLTGPPTEVCVCYVWISLELILGYSHSDIVGCCCSI